MNEANRFPSLMKFGADGERKKGNIQHSSAREFA